MNDHETKDSPIPHALPHPNSNMNHCALVTNPTGNGLLPGEEEKIRKTREKKTKTETAAPAERPPDRTLNK